MYLIPVRNEHTGEIRTVEVLARFEMDAQVEALNRVFQENQWSKAVALCRTSADDQLTA